MTFCHLSLWIGAPLLPWETTLPAIDFLTSLLALALLWRRQKSILDLWLTVAVVVLVAELWVTTFVIGTRYSLGFYASRLLSLTVSVVILIVLLTESYGSLCASLQRNRAIATRARQSAHECAGSHSSNGT